jgi:energy-converting hydrogenase Eha subunit G
MANIDGKALVNTAYHGAVVTGLTIGCAKLVHMIFKKAAVPKLDADMYDAGMLVLDVSFALAIRDVLVRQGILPPDIMK